MRCCRRSSSGVYYYSFTLIHPFRGSFSYYADPIYQRDTIHFSISHQWSANQEKKSAFPPLNDSFSYHFTHMRPFIHAHHPDCKKYVMMAEGYDLRSVMTTPGVQGEKTLSNHIIEMEEILGIEAARQSIIDQVRALLQNSHLFTKLPNFTCAPSIYILKKDSLQTKSLSIDFRSASLWSTTVSL